VGLSSASSDGAGAVSSYAVRIWITPIHVLVQQIAASRLSDYRIYINRGLFTFLPTVAITLEKCLASNPTRAIKAAQTFRVRCNLQRTRLAQVSSASPFVRVAKSHTLSGFGSSAKLSRIVPWVQRNMSAEKCQSMIENIASEGSDFWQISTSMENLRAF
jgi:hypothetical protein